MPFARRASATSHPRQPVLGDLGADVFGRKKIDGRTPREQKNSFPRARILTDRAACSNVRALRGPVDERRFENNPLLYLDFIFYFSNLSHPKLIYLTLVTPSPPRLNLVEPFIPGIPMGRHQQLHSR